MWLKKVSKLDRNFNSNQLETCCSFTACASREDQRLKNMKAGQRGPGNAEERTNYMYMYVHIQTFNASTEQVLVKTP